MAYSLKTISILSIVFSIGAALTFILVVIIPAPIRGWLFFPAMFIAAAAYTFSRLSRLRKFDLLLSAISDEGRRRALAKYVRVSVVISRVLDGFLAVCGVFFLIVSNGILQIGSGIGLLALGASVIILERNISPVMQKVILLLDQQQFLEK